MQHVIATPAANSVVAIAAKQRVVAVGTAVQTGIHIKRKVLVQVLRIQQLAVHVEFLCAKIDAGSDRVGMGRNDNCYGLPAIIAVALRG